MNMKVIFLKLWYFTTLLYSVTTQKTMTLIFIPMKILNLTVIFFVSVGTSFVNGLSTCICLQNFLQ
jgi:hypothetical protein